MNIDEQYDIDYYDPIKKSAIRVLSDDKKMFAVWFEENECILEVHYDKTLKTLNVLDGRIGAQLKSTNLEPNIKVERLNEALRNALWDYFQEKDNIKENGLKIIP